MQRERRKVGQNFYSGESLQKGNIGCIWMQSFGWEHPHREEHTAAVAIGGVDPDTLI